MRPIRTLLGLAAALTAAPLPSQAQEASDLLVLGSLFCSLRAGGAEEPARYLLTADLLALVDRAQARSDAIQQARPNEKPPLGDGIPYQSFPDAADECRAADYKIDGETITLDIAYTFKTQQGADWTDHLVVKRESGRPLIDDVRYGAEGATDSLRDVLKAAEAAQ